MQTAKFWNQLIIQWRKVVIALSIFAILPLGSFAQLNFQQFEHKKIYFGITLGYNSSDFKLTHSSEFIHNDSIYVVNPRKGPGFNLGIISNLKLGKYFDVRFIPSLSFAEKNLEFDLLEDSATTRTIESIYMEFPVSIRFKSQPFGDVRIYVLGGMKYGLDFASNAEKRKAEDQVTIGQHDLSYEYGIGVQFFFPMFIFSPELKISHGLFNVHVPNQQLNLARGIDKLFSRTFLISLHFEG